MNLKRSKREQTARKSRTWLALSFVLLSTALFASCINQGTNTSTPKPSSDGSSGSSSGGTTAPTIKFTMLAPPTVVFPQAQAGGNNTTPPTFTIFFDSSDRTNALTDVCQAQANGGDPSRACLCRFAWTESNNTSSYPIDRLVETAPTQVAAYSITCPGPDVYFNEIDDGISIKITIAPDASSNTHNFAMANVLNYPKTAAQSQDSDFQDAEGRTFKNVVHYVCHDQLKKPLLIDHQQGPVNGDGASTPVVRPMANEFISTGTADSAQTYYYDYYVRSGSEGEANQKPVGYICPKVNIAGIEKYFPSDSTFAVSLNKSNNFPVPVFANIITGLTGPQNTYLGYAAKPNADGTCTTFVKSGTGTVLQTFRLRKYKVAYPLRYGSDGNNVDAQQQPANYVLILDRPINKGGDSTKVLTRLGPKPCPIAFKADSPNYRCVADLDYYLNSVTRNASQRVTAMGVPIKNVDGTAIPKNIACPIYPPIRDDDMFDNQGNFPIRPFRPFLPYFVEDTTFRACAPQSQNPVDPEIIYRYDPTVYSDSTAPKAFYCAIHYPKAAEVIESSQGVYGKHPQSCTDRDFRRAIMDFSDKNFFAEASKVYACSRSYPGAGNIVDTPSSGCCQRCVGKCASTPDSRNAALNAPPAELDGPNRGLVTLGRGKPNVTSTGCYDPYED